MKVVIVRSHLETVSPRVIRNAETLAAQNYEVTILCWDRMLSWDRKNKHPKIELKDNYIIRRFKLRATSGPGIIFFLPIWWSFVFLWLIKSNWDVVHAIEFDSVLPAIISAKIKRKRIIYELNDIYIYMVPLPSIIKKIGLFIERLFTKFADAVIIAEEATIDEFNGIPNNNLVLIYNSPPDYFNNKNTPVLKEGIKAKDPFIIFYAGALFKYRNLNLDKLIDAVKSLDNNLKLIIAGYGDLVNEIKNWIADANDKVQFIGKIEYNEVMERTEQCDLLVFLHDPGEHINRLISSNKIFEAMMFGKPILVVKGGYTAEIVQRENCGLLLDNLSAEKISGAIEMLRTDYGLRYMLGKNGKNAFDQKYSWKIMKSRLLGLYESMEGKCYTK